MIAALVLLMSLGTAFGLIVSIAFGLYVLARMGRLFAKVAVGGLAFMAVVAAFSWLVGGG